MSPADRTLRTYRWERWRCICAGILETAGNTFLLLLAVQNFHAGAVAKALVAAGGSFGLLISPIVVNVVQRQGWKPTAAIARLLTFGAVASLVAALVPVTWIGSYALACLLAMTTTSAIIPLLTQVYQDNYPVEQRGRLYSRAFLLRILAAVTFGFLGGQWLEPGPQFSLYFPALSHWLLLHPERFRGLPIVFSVAFMLAAMAVKRVPSTALQRDAGAHPLSAWRFVQSDRLFRQALIAWMLMGFANLAMLPMRVEYLGNPKYDLRKTAAEIALLTLVIPNVARLLLNPMWGWLFDRMKFFALRITLNLGFALGIAAFFTSNSWPGLVTGAVIYGISNAGGDVAWGLWVTKFAPANHVADYMSVHTFLTGVRGVLAPFVAFQIVQRFSPQAMGWVAGAMIVAASLILLPEIWTWSAHARGHRGAVEPAED